MFTARAVISCIKIFVHAEDRFVYTSEQEPPNGNTFIGWMNV
jgi:hypothetical protein